MNVYLTSTILSTDITRLEQELAAAQEIGARPETIESIQERLQKAKEDKEEENKYQAIEYIKRWSNHYLLKRYDEATNQGEQMFENKNTAEFEIILKLIEQIEDEGRERQLYPFITESEFEYRIIWTLGEITIAEGFVSSKRIGEKLNYPANRLKALLGQLHDQRKILRYTDEEDLWAVSVAARERLGIFPKLKKETKQDLTIKKI